MDEEGNTTQKPKLSKYQQMLLAQENCPQHEWEYKGHYWDTVGDFLLYVCKKCGKRNTKNKPWWADQEPFQE